MEALLGIVKIVADDGGWYFVAPSVLASVMTASFFRLIVRERQLDASALKLFGAYLFSYAGATVVVSMGNPILIFVFAVISLPIIGIGFVMHVLVLFIIRFFSKVTTKTSS